PGAAARIHSSYFVLPETKELELEGRKFSCSASKTSHAGIIRIGFEGISQPRILRSTPVSMLMIETLLHDFCKSASVQLSRRRANDSRRRAAARLPSGTLLKIVSMTFSERFREIRTGFERPFWVANISELFERLSYYAAFASLPRYLHESLNFSVERASSLAGLFGGLVWFLAAFGGALADRMGFRRALSLAYLILATSYFLLGSIGSPWLAPVRSAMPLVALVTFILMLPALGIALVKPCVVGTTARASKENVRSIGYSIYYTVVNIGGATGPFLAGWVHQHLSVEK